MLFNDALSASRSERKCCDVAQRAGVGHHGHVGGPSGRQQELIDQLRELLEQARRTDGFVDGRIHASLDGSRVVSYSTMRSAADNQGFQERDEIHERMQALEAIAVPHRSAYELVGVFTATADTGSNAGLSRSFLTVRLNTPAGPISS